jgi:hypothetical protein
MRKSVLVVAALAVWLSVCSCGPHPPSHDLLRGWVGNADKATVKAELGLPSMSLPLADGTTEWRYRFGYDALMEDGVGPANEVCWHYTLTFDRNDVLQNWSRERCRGRADPLRQVRDRADDGD